MSGKKMIRQARQGFVARAQDGTPAYTRWINAQIRQLYLECDLPRDRDGKLIQGYKNPSVPDYEHGFNVLADC